MYTNYSKLFEFFQVFAILIIGDNMKSKGFTLVELLAVIVILAFLILFAVLNIIGFITDSKNKANEIMATNLADAAVSYSLNKLFIPDKCALPNEIKDNNVTMPSGCTKNTVTVKELVTQNFFTDDKYKCKRDTEIIIYKYYNPSYNTYEIKAYVPDGTCIS